MYAVITTEEYKELLSAKQDGEVYMMQFTQAVSELKETKSQLDNLLLCITKGAKRSQWQDGKFEGFDLARDFEIANYINENFMRDSRLTVKEKNND
jgi:hypothetical protein